MKKKRTSVKHNSRNIFGERCIAKSVDLKKKTAVQQYLEALDDIEEHQGQRIEYTFTSTTMNAYEFHEAMEEVKKIMQLRSAVRSGSHFPAA